ncbi:DUF4232 domain-containing protein [Saccharopolyspora sp. MS10]|uniref:DUF4232 domain-containing protein n=1 Tax=Saccharopolyspora sp. MS10 TaxID=3385973 RepID=UPI0039A191B7
MFSQRWNDRMPTGTRRMRTRFYQVTAAALGAALLGGCGSMAGQQPVPQVSDSMPSVPVPGPPTSQQEAPSSEQAASPAAESSASATGQAAADPAQVERCHTSMLSGSVEHGDSGAGQRYAELRLTNTSGETCTLYGYGGMQLLGAGGERLPTQLERTPNPGPAVVRLAPGESASSTLHWTAVPHAGEPERGDCQPKPTGALVTPPDEEDPLTVSWNLGAVCGFGSIDNSAYHG